MGRLNIDIHLLARLDLLDREIFIEKMTSNKLYLFGDQTGDTLSSIRELTGFSARYPSLKSFFDRSTDRLRSALSKSTHQHRLLFFANPLDLALAVKTDHLHDSALAAALLCISQIGSLIVYGKVSPKIKRDILAYWF